MGMVEHWHSKTFSSEETTDDDDGDMEPPDALNLILCCFFVISVSAEFTYFRLVERRSLRSTNPHCLPPTVQTSQVLAFKLQTLPFCSEFFS